MGIRNFKDKVVQELASGTNSKSTRKLLPVALHRSAIKKLQILRAAGRLDDLRNFPGLNLEKLKGDRKDQFSIRINAQYRICFYWDNIEAFDVTIEDYH